MRAAGPLAVLAVASVVSSGCALHQGQNFARPSEDCFSLGQTTYLEVAAGYGAPSKEGTLIRHGREVKTILYSYVSKFAVAHAAGVTPVRAIHFCFSEGVLVGYDFASSFEEDHTDFDERKISEIHEGRTTKENLVKFLGPPHGRSVYPLTELQGEVGWVYGYGQLRRESGLYKKILSVTFTPDGVVRRVTYSSSGNP